MSKGMLRAIKNSYPKPIAEGYTVEIGASTAEATVQEANIDTLTRVGDGTISIEPRLTGVRAPVVVATPGEDAARGSFARLLENPTTSLYKLQNKLAGKILNLTPSLWLEADTDNVTVDSAQRVSQWSDISGNSRHFTQATDGYKPVLSRADNLENRILYSEQFDNAAWLTPFGMAYKLTADPNVANNPLTGTATASTLQEEAGVSAGSHGIATAYQAVEKDVPYSYSAYFKKFQADATYIGIQIYGTPGVFDATQTWVWACIDLDNGTIKVQSPRVATYGWSVNITDVGSGWYRLELVGPALYGSGNVQMHIIGFSEAATPASHYLATARKWYVYGAQIKMASADPAYIATTTHPWFRGINGHRTLVFDGVDDVLARTDFIGTGADTIFVVSQPYSFGGANAGRLLDNGKTIHSLNSTNSLVDFTSDGSTTAKTANDSVTLNSVAVHAVTRTAAGAANHYINGLLSGTADQASGTPEAATTDLCLGNRAARDRGFHGPITAVIAFPKVLTAPEMNLIYNYFAAKAGTTALESVGQNGFIHSILLGWDSSRATKAHPRQRVDNRSPMPRMMGMLVDPDTEEILIGSRLATLAVDTSVSTLTFATPFEREPVAVAVPLNATAATAKITAISKTAVSVETFDIATGAVADVKFYIIVLGWDRENETSDFRKKLKTPLVKPRMEALRVLLTGTTPTVTVSADLATITRSGVGDYTLTLNEPFKQYPVALVTGLTGLAVLSDGVSQSEVKVKVFDSLGEAVDSGFDVLILGTDSPSEYAGPMPDELPSGNGDGEEELNPPGGFE